jgi:hypothetical protein
MLALAGSASGAEGVSATDHPCQVYVLGDVSHPGLYAAPTESEFTLSTAL